MDAFRAINELVFALIFVAAVGLGPLAGVLALTIHTTGTLAKLFSEAVEAIARVIKSDTTPFSLKTELIQALSWIEQQGSLATLGDVLQTASESLSLEIIKVFGRITDSDRQGQATEILLNFWQQKTEVLTPNIRQDLAYSLGQLKQVIAQPLLTKLSEDNDSGVKLHAIAALNKLPTANS